MATRTARDPWVVDRVARLTRLRALYESGEPEVSDAEYDRLVDELAVVAPGEKFLRSVGGAVVESSGATLRHAAPMLSLAKETDPTRAATWCTDRDVVLMPKLDGVAVSAVFDAGTGVLVHAATRGDGREGRAISTLVRAALARLASEGLIEIGNKRTATVAQPSLDEARAVFEVRRCLEAEVVRLVCQRWQAAWRAPLQAHVSQEQAAAAAQASGAAAAEAKIAVIVPLVKRTTTSKILIVVP